MVVDRRGFLAGLAGLVGAGAARSRSAEGGAVRTRRRAGGMGFDPWIDVDRDALLRNARAAGTLAGGRPVLAVVKNNGYGHGVVEAGRALAAAPGVRGLAVVKVEEALALREAGVEAPVLHMGYAPDDAAEALAAAGVQLSAFQERDPERLARLARRLGSPLDVHLYLDTGMARMGIPVDRALPWARRMVGEAGDAVRIRGSYAGFTEEDRIDARQLDRFLDFAASARDAGLEPGPLHHASSHGLFHRMPRAGLDMVRPGLVLYGAYPAAADRNRADLRPALRLRARVVRTQRLEPGQGVSYGHNYVADRPTWIATIPAGHVDGVPRSAVDGCRVLVGDRTYRVIGAVSASHTIVEVGREERVRVGDPVTLVGPDHPDVHPNAVAEAGGVSVYDVLMHLGAGLPRRVV